MRAEVLDSSDSADDAGIRAVRYLDQFTDDRAGQVIGKHRTAAHSTQRTPRSGQCRHRSVPPLRQDINKSAAAPAAITPLSTLLYPRHRTLDHNVPRLTLTRAARSARKPNHVRERQRHRDLTAARNPREPRSHSYVDRADALLPYFHITLLLWPQFFSRIRRRHETDRESWARRASSAGATKPIRRAVLPSAHSVGTPGHTLHMLMRDKFLTFHPFADLIALGWELEQLGAPKMRPGADEFIRVATFGRGPRGASVDVDRHGQMSQFATYTDGDDHT